MATFYDRMQATATRLLTKYNQNGNGTIYIRRKAITHPGNPWHPVTDSYLDHEIKAVVEPVAKRYINNTSIKADARMVIFNVLSGFTPDIKDQILLGSELFEIIRLECYPGAGTPAYYEAVISA